MIFWYTLVYAFAMIGVLATFLIICFAICVIKLQRESEVGAIDLDAVEGERNE
jgi:hypothetical protein